MLLVFLILHPKDILTLSLIPFFVGFFGVASCVMEYMLRCMHRPEGIQAS